MPLIFTQLAKILETKIKDKNLNYEILLIKDSHTLTFLFIIKISYLIYTTLKFKK